MFLLIILIYSSEMHYRITLDLILRQPLHFHSSPFRIHLVGLRGRQLEFSHRGFYLHASRIGDLQAALAVELQLDAFRVAARLDDEIVLHSGIVGVGHQVYFMINVRLHGPLVQAHPGPAFRDVAQVVVVVGLLPAYAIGPGIVLTVFESHVHPVQGVWGIHKCIYGCGDKTYPIMVKVGGRVSSGIVKAHLLHHRAGAVRQLPPVLDEGNGGGGSFAARR